MISARNEIWEYIPGFNKKYKVSTVGRVKSFYRDKVNGILRKDQLRRGGYRGVILINKNKEKVNMLIHRLVAMTFIPNPLGKKDINHINLIRDHNVVSNLEWVTHQENIAHSLAIREKIKAQQD